MKSCLCICLLVFCQSSRLEYNHDKNRNLVFLFSLLSHQYWEQGLACRKCSGMPGWVSKQSFTLDRLPSSQFPLDFFQLCQCPMPADIFPVLYSSGILTQPGVARWRRARNTLQWELWLCWKSRLNLNQFFCLLTWPQGHVQEVNEIFVETGETSGKSGGFIEGCLHPGSQMILPGQEGADICHRRVPNLCILRCSQPWNPICISWNQPRYTPLRQDSGRPRHDNRISVKLLWHTKWC